MHSQVFGDQMMVGETDMAQKLDREMRRLGVSVGFKQQFKWVVLRCCALATASIQGGEAGNCGLT